jgi:photosystem II stability/assembly factor-like uncharacterized protein
MKFLFLLVLLSVPAGIQAQFKWERFGQDQFESITKYGDRTYIASDEGRLLYSKGNVHVWAAVQLDTAITSVAVNRQGVLLVGGYYGHIHRSTDLGATWASPAVAKNKLRHVEFFNDTNALAVGDKGAAYFTVDAGITWHTSEFPTLHSAFALAVRPDGYALLGTYQQTLWRSTDFGRSWDSLRTFSQPLRAIECKDSLTLIAGDLGLLFVSKRDGAAFDSIRIPETLQQNFRKAVIINEDSWILFGDKSPIVTTTGGKSWLSYDLPRAIGFRRPIRDAVWRGDTLIVCGYPNLIAVSLDSAKTWEYLSIGFDDFAFVAKVQCVDSLRYYAIGQNNIIQRTSDAGLTWSDRLHTNNYYSLQDLRFTSRDSGVVIGLRGFIERTTNNGQTWDPIFAQQLNCNYLHIATGTTNPNEYVLPGDSVILHTTDNFTNTKKLVYLSGKRGYTFSDFHVVSKDLWYGIGRWNWWDTDTTIDWMSYFIVSTDQGDTWIERKEWRGERAEEFVFLDSLTGIMTVSNEIYRTTDAGYTWSKCQKISFDKQVITDIQYRTPSLLFGVAQLGTMIYSNDSGKTWQRLPYPEIDYRNEIAQLYYLSSVAFPDSNSVMFVGQGGMVKMQIPAELTSRVELAQPEQRTLYIKSAKIPGTSSERVQIFGLSGSGRESTTLHLVDVQGRLVRDLTDKLDLASNSPTKEFVLDVESLSSGIYFLELKHQRDQFVHKLSLVK